MANSKAMAAPGADSIRAPKKGKTGLIILLVFIALLLAGIALVAFNVFGLRDNMLFPLLRNIPIVGDMVPEGVYTAEEELSVRLAEVEAEFWAAVDENESLTQQLGNISQRLAASELEVQRLREIEQNQEQIQLERETFIRETAAENPYAFINFFETIEPALAEEIFRTLAAAQIAEEEWQNYVASWNAMNAAQVAAVIEDMLTTNMPLIVRVMQELPEPFRGTVLNTLAPESAGAVLRAMEP